jgi:hypothetical protein
LRSEQERMLTADKAMCPAQERLIQKVRREGGGRKKK